MDNTTRPTKPKAPKTPVLPRIAAALKDMARERASGSDPELRERPVTHLLSHGARIDLRLSADSNGFPIWRLRIARKGVFPGDVEMDTFRRDFSVRAPWQQEQQHWTVKDTDGAPVTYYAYVIQWFAQDKNPRSPK